MPAADDILTLAEVSAALRLDPRTVRRVASRIGGRRIGNRWRFRWGTVMEFFDAYARQPFQQVRNHYLAAQLLSGSRKQGARPGKRSEKPSLFAGIKERLWKKH